MQIYLHSLMFLEESVQSKLLATLWNNNIGLPLEHAIQVVMKALNASMEAAKLWSVQIALDHYVLYNSCTLMFKIIRSPGEECAPELQRTCDWEAIVMCSHVTLKMRQWHKEHLTAAMKQMNLCATSHLPYSARSLRWWRKASCIRWNARRSLIGYSIQSGSGDQEYFHWSFENILKAWQGTGKTGQHLRTFQVWKLHDNCSVVTGKVTFSAAFITVYDSF